MSSVVVKKPIGFYPVAGSNSGYYQVEGGGISRPSEMTDMFDTLSIKCRFRWPSSIDSPGRGALFCFSGSRDVVLVIAYNPGTNGSSGQVGFISGPSASSFYLLPSLPVLGSDDEVEYRIGSNKISLLYHGAEVASGAVSDSAGMITDVLGRAFTLGVYTDGGTLESYYPGLISSVEITWYSSAFEGVSCITNYYAAENITDSVWRNSADGVVVGVPIQYQPIKAVFYDSSTGSFIKLSPDEITEVNPNYTPIGVEVIPAEHDVYGTGQAGIMSLAEMNYSTPDVGSSNRQGIYWGKYGTDTSLSNYDVVNYIGGRGNLNNGEVQGTANYAFLPSDQFSAVTGLDGKSNYNSYNSAYYAPSPFNADGSRNEAYYTTSYSTANALSDFDGVGNTNILTELATSQRDWKTATTITNGSNTDCYPAACCTWRFHTAGTEQGQWYLPAAGEFGYVINRLSAINATINKVLSVYSSVVAVEMSTDAYYWSSSEYNAANACLLYTALGYVVGLGKYTNDRYARAFLRL